MGVRSRGRLAIQRPEVLTGRQEFARLPCAETIRARRGISANHEAVRGKVSHVGSVAVLLLQARDPEGSRRKLYLFVLNAMLLPQSWRVLQYIIHRLLLARCERLQVSQALFKQIVQVVVFEW